MSTAKLPPVPQPHGVLPPPVRKLRAYSFDPSLSSKFETRVVNERVFPVAWEDKLKPGPVGEYVEVMDFDPASGLWYEPVDLNNPYVLAQDGLPPDASNPMFHQQMVYAVAMTTIQNFERALGRPAIWRPRRSEPSKPANGKDNVGTSAAPVQAANAATGPEAGTDPVPPPDDGSDRATGARKPPSDEEWVPHLRIYPHALREANAYYSPDKVALLFGYFPLGDTKDGQYPGGMIFTCLSHDVIAHEMAHALLDGVHPRLTEWTQPDGPAFHEAFADIVALFQHFTFREVLQHQIARTRGDLETESLLGALAQEFGRATGTHGALRDALGEVNRKTGKWERRPPDPARLARTVKPHDRGAILVAAVFDAFLTIYRSRIADLRRIASGGSGILPVGELHPDLVARFADEAARSAQHVLTMCIRAIDYIQPVDVTFGDFLRGMMTADRDIYPSDNRGYRVAFVDAFRSHGIYPSGLRALSEQNLMWDTVSEADQTQGSLSDVLEHLKTYFTSLSFVKSREERWQRGYRERIELWKILDELLLKGRKHSSEPGAFEAITGLDFGYDNSPRELGHRRVHVYTLSTVQRMDENGKTRNLAVLTLLQRRRHYSKGEIRKKGNGLDVWGGCTMVFDLDLGRLLYAVRKSVRIAAPRVQRAVQMRIPSSSGEEPFAMLHRRQGQ